VGVPHDLAEKYARWVGGALPTEAQWEYTARSGGKPLPYVWGKEPGEIKKNANIDSIGILGNIPTMPVGSFPGDKTEQGVLDLTGNVREWCRDLWARYVDTGSPEVNPSGPASSEGATGEHVIRGGSFLTFADMFRTTRPRRQDKDAPTAGELAEDGSASDLGFRVVLERPARP
jgi:serine/threonine-protein kinase